MGVLFDIVATKLRQLYTRFQIFDVVFFLELKNSLESYIPALFCFAVFFCDTVKKYR